MAQTLINPVMIDPAGASENDVIKLVEGVFAPSALNEDEISGITTYNAINTGTVDLDLSTFIDHYMILTGNTTITVSSTPASGFSFVRNLLVKSDTTETLTLPASWKVEGVFVADGSENNLTIKFSNFPTVGLKVNCFIS